MADGDTPQPTARGHLAAGTLGYHRFFASFVFGEDSPAVAWLDKKIRESPLGLDEPVLADESQVVYLLTELHNGRTGESGSLV